MTNIDFLISFALIISTIFMIIYFISNSVSNNAIDTSINELKESSMSLEKYLFEINDDKSLISTTRELQTALNETNNTDHNAEIRLSIKPQVDNVKVYDSFFNEMTSSSQQLSGETILSFTLFFSAYEKKNLNILYFGNPVNDIDYLSSDNNITVRILSDKEVNIVSQEKCSKLKGSTYDYVKDVFGFQNDFKLDLEDCSFGPEPPIKANTILRNIPVLFETADGPRSTIARLRIW